MDTELDLIIARLAAAVKSSGLSFVRLEEKTGVPKSSIQRYVTGKTRKIPIDNVKKIAEACGVSAEYIMGWSEPEIDTSVDEEDIKFALFSGADEVTDEMWQRVKEFARMVQQAEQFKKDQENK